MQGGFKPAVGKQNAVPSLLPSPTSWHLTRALSWVSCSATTSNARLQISAQNGCLETASWEGQK